MARNIPKQLQNGLVLWLDSAGKDLSGNGNNGTLVNAPTKVRRLQNDGLSYNGSNQSVTTSYSYAGGNFTMSAWLYNNSTSQGRRPLGWSSEASGAYACTAYTYLSGKMHWVLRSSGGTSYDFSGISNSSTGVWEHYVFVLNGSTATAYKNGVQDGQNTSVGTLGARNFVFGSSTEGGATSFYDGKIINPMIYNRALSAKEIELLYVSTFIK